MQKILNKILPSKIPKTLKMIISHEQFDFIPGMQRWSIIDKSVSVIQHINWIRIKNDIITLIDAKNNN
jgi:hypothetical protein